MGDPSGGFGVEAATQLTRTECAAGDAV